MTIPRPGEMNLTLVAYYGVKPEPVRELIVILIDEIKDCLGAAFEEYSIEQVHGTIIGLEGVRTGEDIVNTNYLELRGERRVLDLTAALDIVSDHSLLPFDVTIGGYKVGGAYSFTSRGKAPYLRSFSIQGKSVVAMGWPSARGTYSQSMDILRRRFNTANILHRYHASADDRDNDFFFVLGIIRTEETSESQLLETQERIRAFMASLEPIPIKIAESNLTVVAYVDTGLPADTSCCYTIDDARNRLDEIKMLYREVTD